MSTPTSMLDKLNKVNLELLMQISMEDTAKTAVQQQKLQLQQGLRSDESSLPDYAPSSVARGKPAGPIRLYDKGDFYKGFLLDVRNDIFILESADRKSPMLQTKWGKDILGLGIGAKRNWIEVLTPVFIYHVERELL